MTMKTKPPSRPMGFACRQIRARPVAAKPARWTDVRFLAFTHSVVLLSAAILSDPMARVRLGTGWGARCRSNIERESWSRRLFAPVESSRRERE